MKIRTDDEKRNILKTVTQLRATGTGLLAACKGSGIDPSQFYVWQKKLGMKKKSPTKAQPGKTPKFVDLTIPAETDRLIILMGRSQDILTALNHMNTVRQ